MEQRVSLNHSEVILMKESALTDYYRFYNMNLCTYIDKMNILPLHFLNIDMMSISTILANILIPLQLQHAAANLNSVIWKIGFRYENDLSVNIGR